MVYYRDNWYLDCWCHLRKGIRTFSIDAIESVESLVDAAKELPIKKLRETLADGYGIFSGKPTQWAKLRIGATSARWIAQTVWHSGQKSSFDAADNYVLEIPYTDDRELIKDILGLLPDVEILAPDTLRKRIGKILKESMRKFSRPTVAASYPK
jgi:predicted DNA-binding transcriptional regulator YafY